MPDKKTEQYKELSTKTASNLKAVAQSDAIRQLSALSLPEIDRVVELVGRVVPAGNVPGVILNGLARLSGRRLPVKTIKRDVDLLFKGIEQSLDQAVYAAFFAGPAAVIWGYQNLLKLGGKDPNDSFPEGLWQFYADYALREDTARHANETHGFDTLLGEHQIRLDPVDRITAWVMTAIHCLHQYDALLQNEWRERVYTYWLGEVTRQEPEADQYAGLYRAWLKQLPYGRGSDAGPDETYPLYRRIRFDRFLEAAMQDLRPELRHAWLQRVRRAKEADLPAYQQQMSIAAYLDPGIYGETRTAIPLKQAHIGLIHRRRYYLIPVCRADAEQPAPPDVNAIRAKIAALLQGDGETAAAQLTRLARMRRATWPKLRPQLNPDLLEGLDKLRTAPILINCGPVERHLPLAELRQAERGVGDHALTIFDTGQSFVFDQSHIFFDGGWGAALAEIMSREALSWAVYLHSLPPPAPAEGDVPLRGLAFPVQTAELELIRQAPQVTPEADAETDLVDIQAILRLRKLFKRRSDLLRLTVNDLLVLYRAIHAATYEPDPKLLREVQNLSLVGGTQAAAEAALEAIKPADPINPPMVIPVDAGQRSPQDRLYPMTFEVPLAELDLLNLHERIMAALDAYKQAEGDRSALYEEFDDYQRVYLSSLAGFGAVLSKAKEIALEGESVSMGTMKLLAHMPTPLQRMLDQVPSRFEVLNDLIKGREVFSNVGAVSPSSSLVRFITAKDDNDKKTLAWGIMTDANRVMRLSLRDFRPHAALLQQIGRKELAAWIARDYLEAYARGLNDYIADLERITETSRETQLSKPEKQS